MAVNHVRLCYFHILQGFCCNFMTPDNPWGVLNLLPNMINSFGWKPTSKVYNEMGKHIEKKVGDADITFKQLYMKKGIELCICVTNVNRMNVTFCHVKTTPHLPIRRAVCMSMSIPEGFIFKRKVKLPLYQPVVQTLEFFASPADRTYFQVYVLLLKTVIAVLLVKDLIFFLP
ncbi:hypothetical protein LOTGIDRAFT_168658 [Lottia gigantea]|uniref:Uncharacterized protein n=1 Tax=Lottia gigantea TaxID=225164 RepID=V3Z208_LOTGI|nr:hypothetical protein LOTGIDRAFT_168658 [Lottia gigantea]ESO84593.1 hypothetical protein LOTGIDRAFT_168658 [Lottia gigantea]